ncbi:MAG: hypothetical protein KF764_08755 [Labilithrix sp.]|nr:hypothetical protein [Labilithrix sp.]
MTHLGIKGAPAHPAMVTQLHEEKECLRREVERLKTALGEVAALGDRCEECDCGEAEMATHVTAHPLTGIPIFLCAVHAKETDAAYRRAESKGCGEQPLIEEHEQETAVQIALAALGPAGKKGGT